MDTKYKTHHILEAVLLVLWISGCSAELPDSTDAAEASHKEVVELLISKGADANAKDNQGRTALWYAQNKGHIEIIELLRKHEMEEAAKYLELSKATAKKSKRFNDVADLVFTGESGGRQQFGNYLFNGDVNGDGYQDILTTASNYDNRRGRAYLYYGGPDMDAKADKIFTGENPTDLFGEGAFLSDLNNDGFSDVILGSLGYNNRTGKAYVYYGGPDMDINPDLILEGEKPDTAFGRRIAAGDVNGDGYNDLFITAHKFDNYRGRVYLYFGGELFDIVADKKFDGEATDDTFGIFLSARGDVDGDGCDDLLVGTPYWPQNTTKRGRAYLFFGDPCTNMDNVPDVIFTGENNGDDLGVAIDLFDIDNDGYADAMIGARKWPSGTLHGRAYLYWGSDRSTFDNIADVIIDGQKGVKESFGGNVFYAGYINDDKYGDFIVGAYDYFRTSREGRAYLFYGGTKATLDTNYDHVFEENVAPMTDFGKEGKLCDLNGDGLDDVILGAWQYNNGQGRVYVYFNKGIPSSSLSQAVTDGQLE